MPIITDYKIGVKREVVTALKPVFGPNYPDPNLASKIYVGLEFPMEEIRYPAIYVTYNEGPIENVGIGHYEVDDQLRIIDHFKFRGTLNFNVLALKPIDRDMLSAGLIQMLTVGRNNPVFKDFHEQIMDGDWVSLHIMKDYITPSGEVTAPVPWNDDEMQIYSNSYSVAIFGEFIGDAQTGDLIQIGQVNIYPYRKGSAIPQGVSDPAPWE
jgi:hypothetical protein